MRGLADERLAIALRRMHERPAKAWTVAQLVNEAALSRSAFFERFSRAVGVAPKEVSVAEVAEQVGYRSASTFSVAFTRHVGLPPTHYARKDAEPRYP